MKQFNIPFPPGANVNATTSAFQVLSELCTKMGCSCNMNTPNTLSIGIPEELGPETIFTMGAIWGQELANATIMRP